MAKDSGAQLIAIPHSSGGSPCGKVLDALTTLDQAKTVMQQKVTLLSLDAGADRQIGLFSKGIYHPDGFIGVYARDTEDTKKPEVKSFNSYIANEIKAAGGIAKEVAGNSRCRDAQRDLDASKRQRLSDVRCEHFALFCHQPPHVDWDELVLGGGCPTSLTDLESTYLDWIPFD